jgi:hypothetical protein
MDQYLLEKIRRLKEKTQPVCSGCGKKIGEINSIGVVDPLTNKMYCGDCYNIREYELL